MTSRISAWLAVTLTMTGVLVSTVVAEPAVQSTPQTNALASGGKGVIEGVVRYRADAQRPWNFARYYVSSGPDGPLAEAVVALSGPTLAAQAGQAAARSWTMDQMNYQFVPETLAIRAGDEVRISNSDDALHNVMTADGGRPFNVNVAKGVEFTNVFTQPGGLSSPVRLGCIFHGGMRAWIYVFDHPWFKVTGRDGRFRFTDIPLGQYTLGLVHPAGRLRWSRPVIVESNVVTTVEISLSPDQLPGSKSDQTSPPTKP